MECKRIEHHLWVIPFSLLFGNPSRMGAFLASIPRFPSSFHVAAQPSEATGARGFFFSSSSSGFYISKNTAIQAV